MLRRPDIAHILRAAASLSGHSRFVMVGTPARGRRSFVTGNAKKLILHEVERITV
jgi:hypothetical protein